MQYWLFKTEPSAYSIDDLAREGVGRWDGVRNYQARNFLRDHVAAGDRVFIYHSSTAVPGIAGTGMVVKAGYPDPAAYDPESPYYDPKSSPLHPRWYAVDVRFDEAFDTVLPLAQLRHEPALARMALLVPGQRLSIQPVRAVEWAHIMKLVTRTV